MAGSGVVPRNLPWSGHGRAEDKNSLFEYVCENPEGVPVVYAVRSVVNPEANAGDADHRLAHRFFENHPELFKIDRRRDLIWVEPTVDAFHLTPSKHSPKHTDGDGVAMSNVKNALKRRRTVDEDAARGSLLGGLAAKREATEERFVAFENRDVPSTHLLVQYRTRFNSPSRIADQRETFDSAWGHAAEHFERATMVTLTTDPSRFDSIHSAATSLMDDVNRLKSWYARRFGDGSRPPSLVVPEFTSRSLPHVHVVMFGVVSVPHGPLSHYWDGHRDRGRVVWCDSLTNRDGTWLWTSSSSPERAEGRSPRSYLSKSLSTAATFARAPPSEVHEAAEALRAVDGVDADVDDGDASTDADVDAEALRRGREWWSLACHWATDMKWFTVSPSLKTDDETDDGGDDECSRWRFVGVARHDEFPGHVVRGAIVVREHRGRPPP
ncbi:hypothetical protein [Haloferax sp. DFSO52]|uniref:hypothetical protein n=1 Tax=Haloferax sp. DFSO52 TaxID=3388505 RepID=UPI003A874023